MKISTPDEVQAALAAQSKDSFNLLLLQKKIEDDVNSGDSAALEKDIRDLSTTYRHFVYQDKVLRHSDLDSKMVDQIERDQYTLGQDYKDLEVKARAAVGVSGQGIDLTASAKLTNDLIKAISDANTLSNGSSGASATSKALAQAEVDSNNVFSLWSRIENDIASKNATQLKKDQAALRKAYDDLKAQAAIVQSSGAKSDFADTLMKSIDAMNGYIAQLMAGTPLGSKGADFGPMFGQVRNAIANLRNDTANRDKAAKALATQAKDLANIAALQKSISDDLKNNDSTKLKTDIAALKTANDEFVATTATLIATARDTKLIGALEEQQRQIQTGIDALIKGANNGKDPDPAAAAAMIAALKSAMDLVTKLG